MRWNGPCHDKTTPLQALDSSHRPWWGTSMLHAGSRSSILSFIVLDKNKNRFFVTTTCELGGCGRDYMRVGCDMYSIVVSSVLHIADNKR